MFKLLNPWLILGVLLAIGTAGGVGYYKGNEHAKTAALAEAAKQMTLEEKIQTTIATEVSKIKVTNTVVRGKVETITRENVVYRDCRNDPAVVGMLNDLLAGKISLPAGDSKLPATGTAP